MFARPFRRFSVDEFFESAEPICGPINVKKETSQHQRPQTKTFELQAFPYTGFSRDVLLPGGWRKPAKQFIRYAPVAMRIFTAGLLKGPDGLFD
jgi:hypothetical protein